MTPTERELSDKIDNLTFRLDKLITVLNSSVQIVLEPREIKRQKRIKGKALQLVK